MAKTKQKRAIGPVPKKYRKIVDGALAEANRVRAFFGDKPLKRLPKGIRGEEDSCPIAEAIDHGIGISGNRELEFEVEQKTWKAGINMHTPFIAQFVKLFDDKQLPQFDAKPNEE